MELSINPLDSVLNFGSKLLDKFIPDPVAKAAAQLELVKAAQTGELAKLAAETSLIQGQIETNKIEAASSNIFIAGWRPYIGWICGSGLAVQFLISPVATFICDLFGKHIIMPSLDMGTLMALLISLLGLGGMRTAEKFKGVA
jgi:hypothetical protein